MTALVSPAQQAVKKETEEEPQRKLKKSYSKEFPLIPSPFKVSGSTAYGRNWTEIVKTENFEKFGEVGIIFKKMGDFFFGDPDLCFGEHFFSARLDMVLENHSNQVVTVWLGTQGLKKTDPVQKSATWHIVSKFTQEQLMRIVPLMEAKGREIFGVSEKDLRFHISTNPPKGTITPKVAHDYLIASQLTLLIGVKWSRWKAIELKPFLVDMMDAIWGGATGIPEQLPGGSRPDGERKKYVKALTMYAAPLMGSIIPSFKTGKTRCFFKTSREEIQKLDSSRAAA